MISTLSIILLILYDFNKEGGQHLPLYFCMGIVMFDQVFIVLDEETREEAKNRRLKQSSLDKNKELLRRIDNRMYGNKKKATKYHDAGKSIENGIYYGGAISKEDVEAKRQVSKALIGHADRIARTNKLLQRSKQHIKDEIDRKNEREHSTKTDKNKKLMILFPNIQHNISNKLYQGSS